MNILTGTGSMLTSLLPIVAFGLIIYFMMIRPAQKRQKNFQNMLNDIRVGDNVIMRSGLHGVISEIDEAAHTITVDCEGIFLVFEREAILRTSRPTVEQDASQEVETTNNQEESDS